MTSFGNELTIGLPMLTSTVNEPRSTLSDVEFRQIWESFNKLRMEGRPINYVPFRDLKLGLGLT